MTTPTPPRKPLTVAEALRNIAAEEMERRRNEAAGQQQQPQIPQTDSST